MKSKTKKEFLFGFLSGAVSAALGAGGGMIIVPFLKRNGLDQTAAQQNAVAVILPLSALSSAFYIFKGYASIEQSLVFMPFGVAGALLGGYALRKISPVWLKIIFGGFMVWSGGRMILK